MTSTICIPTISIEMLIGFSFFIFYVLYHTDWFADIQKSLHPWDKSHLIIVQMWKLFSCVRLFATPMDYKYHGILQVRILQWVAVPFSRVSSQPRDWTQVSRIAGRFFTNWAIVYIKLFMYCWICFANILLRMYVFLFILILVCNFFSVISHKIKYTRDKRKEKKTAYLTKDIYEWKAFSCKNT